MPKLQKLFHLEITPEQFLNACSQDEIYETWLLINSHRFRQTIIQFEEKPKKRTDSSGAVLSKAIKLSKNKQQA